MNALMLDLLERYNSAASEWVDGGAKGGAAADVVLTISLADGSVKKVRVTATTSKADLLALVVAKVNMETDYGFFDIAEVGASWSSVESAPRQ